MRSHNHHLGRITFFSILALCALLPLQTHVLISQETVQGVEWPWTEVKVYALDVILFFTAVFVFFTKKTLSHTARHALQLLLLFFVAAFIANALNRVPLHSWIAWLRIGEGILLVWIFAASHVPVKKIAAAFVTGMFLSGCIGLWQFGAQNIPASPLLGIAPQFPWSAGVSILANSFARFLRSYGSFPHPNIFAGYLSIALVCVLYLALRRADVLRMRRLTSITDFMSRNGWTFIVAVLTAALMFSFSRNGWLAASIGVLLLLLTTLWQNKKMALRVWVQSGVVLVLLLLFFSNLFFPLAFGRFTLEDAHEKVSIADRQQATNDFADVVHDRWFQGTGLNMFTSTLATDIDPSRPWWEIQPVHNIYLLLVAETSVFGAAMYLVAFFWVLGTAIHRLKQQTDRFPKAALAVALLVMIFLLGMFDHYTISLVPGIFLLFFVLGISIKALGEHTA